MRSGRAVDFEVVQFRRSEYLIGTDPERWPLSVASIAIPTKQVRDPSTDPRADGAGV
jgi:hypothetical protein